MSSPFPHLSQPASSCRIVLSLLLTKWCCPWKIMGWEQCAGNTFTSMWREKERPAGNWAGRIVKVSLSREMHCSLTGADFESVSSQNKQSGLALALTYKLNSLHFLLSESSGGELAVVICQCHWVRSTNWVLVLPLALKLKFTSSSLTGV